MSLSATADEFLCYYIIYYFVHILVRKTKDLLTLLIKLKKMVNISKMLLYAIFDNFEWYFIMKMINL
jgi:hypothetical protein